MKTIDVVAAVIEKDGRVLATQRGYGEFEGGWEFPGGKVEAGETPEQAIVREIKEELNADIAVRDFLVQVEHDYPTFHLSMKCYLCTLKDASFQLLEHHAAKWLDLAHIESVEWLPADVKVVHALEKRGELQSPTPPMSLSRRRGAFATGEQQPRHRATGQTRATG